MIEPRHGQRIPSGTRLARVMARVLRAMLAHARRSLRNGKVPNFEPYEAVIVQVVTPILMHEYAMGAEDVRRRVRRRKNGKRKGLGYGEDSLLAGTHHGDSRYVRGRDGGVELLRVPTVRGTDSGQGEVFLWAIESTVDERRGVERQSATDAIEGRQRDGTATLKDLYDPILPSIPERFTDPLEIAWNLLRPEVVGEVQRLALDLAGSVTSTAKERVRVALREGLQAGDSVRDIASRISGDFGAERAFTIALTESSRSMHDGQLAAMEATDGIITKKKWLLSTDACEFCQSLARKGAIPLREPFYVNPKGGPYAVVMAAPAHPHCMCSLEEVF